MPPSRRRVMRTLGSTIVLGLPGCSAISGIGQQTPGSTSSETPTTTGTEPPPQRLAIGETATFADGMMLTVADPTVQKSIIADFDAFLTVERYAGHQYVVVSVQGSAAVEPSAFAVRRDGRIEAPPKQRSPVEPVTRDCLATCIGLPIVTGATDDAAVVYQPADRVRATWDLSAETVDLFAVQPRCELRKAELTDRNGDVAVRFTVENVGDRDAGFRALVAPEDFADVSDPVGFPVPKGETVTETVVPRELDGYSPEEATFTHEIDEDTRAFEVGNK